MADWWSSSNDERYWVEIRWAEGTGLSLQAPQLDKNGRQNPWYDLLTKAKPGDVVYHWHPVEGHFLGRSRVSEAFHIDPDTDDRMVPLLDFTPVRGVTLTDVRSEESRIYAIRDRLQQAHPGPLYLPFQFRSDGLRFMPNYFAKLPAELVPVLFGSDGHGGFVSEADWRDDDPSDGSTDPEPQGPSRRGYLQPFAAKGDEEYIANALGGPRRRTRRHETLVNEFARWLGDNFECAPARNQAIDLGLTEPPIIVEAKTYKGSWAQVARQAVGQLYEYRYWQVVDPDSWLILLADVEMPAVWVDYLEQDREIGVVWPDGSGGYTASPYAQQALDEVRPRTSAS
ncbi:MAG: hypothetical protein M3P93_15190 [Actinomycetota bacterium]|jgi:hypothetical protein|nr:hypothetical protein [Actinomycetota bacterium]